MAEAHSVEVLGMVIGAESLSEVLEMSFKVVGRVFEYGLWMTTVLGLEVEVTLEVVVETEGWLLGGRYTGWLLGGRYAKEGGKDWRCCFK